MSKNKIDLTLLKKLVGELENSLNNASNISTDVDADLNEYIVEMSKAVGLCAGIMRESSMLIGDIHTAVRNVQSPSGKNMDILLEKVLGSIKGGGGFGGTN